MFNRIRGFQLLEFKEFAPATARVSFFLCFSPLIRCTTHCHFNRAQVLALPTEQAAPVLTYFSRGYDPYTHACNARPLKTVGRTSLSVIIIINQSHPVSSGRSSPDGLSSMTHLIRRPDIRPLHMPVPLLPSLALHFCITHQPSACSADISFPSSTLLKCFFRSLFELLVSRLVTLKFQIVHAPVPLHVQVRCIRIVHVRKGPIILIHCVRAPSLFPSRPVVVSSVMARRTTTTLPGSRHAPEVQS